MKWNLQFSLYVYIIDVKLIFRSYFIHELSQSWKNASVQKRQQRLQQLEHFQPFRIWKSSWASFPLHSYQQQKLTLLQERAQEKALENLLTVACASILSATPQTQFSLGMEGILLQGFWLSKHMIDWYRLKQEYYLILLHFAPRKCYQWHLNQVYFVS